MYHSLTLSFLPPRFCLSRNVFGSSRLLVDRFTAHCFLLSISSCRFLFRFHIASYVSSFPLSVRKLQEGAFSVSFRATILTLRAFQVFSLASVSNAKFQVQPRDRNKTTLRCDIHFFFSLYVHFLFPDNVSAFVFRK